MLEQYKKTFAPMQLTIWLVSALVVVVTRHLYVGAVFLATMQIGAVVGALWGERLKRYSRRA